MSQKEISIHTKSCVLPSLSTLQKNIGNDLISVISAHRSVWCTSKTTDFFLVLLFSPNNNKKKKKPQHIFASGVIVCLPTSQASSCYWRSYAGIRIPAKICVATVRLVISLLQLADCLLIRWNKRSGTVACGTSRLYLSLTSQASVHFYLRHDSRWAPVNFFIQLPDWLHVAMMQHLFFFFWNLLLC